MDNLIVADASGKELRELMFDSYDIEVGSEDDLNVNTFQIVIKRGEYKNIPPDARIYIPGTEYGGLFKKLETNTSRDIIAPGGRTWRGMMQKKIIQPAAGANYATDSGDLNEIVKAKVESAFPGLFIGSDENTGVTVSNYQYDRYCTLHDGLEKLLKSKGYRLDIQYLQTERAVLVQAVPIVNYAADIEFSADMQLHYVMQMQSNGTNHLICLGSGELADRLVVHLYVDGNGNIVNTQYYTGSDEVAEVYDYAGAEEEDLRESGIERLKECMGTNSFDITIDPSKEIAIGDIVGGQDYLSGMKMTAPITGKIVKWAKGFRTIEYRISDDVEVEVTT